MEEDVEPKDEDGVGGRGVYGWDGWACGLGVVDTSSIFGLVRRTGTYATVFPTFALVSRMQLVQQHRDNGHFLITGRPLTLTYSEYTVELTANTSQRKGLGGISFRLSNLVDWTTLNF
jgi:hypothetical protein